MNAADVKRVTILSCLSSACTLYGGSGDVDAVIAAAEVFYAEATGQRAQLEEERGPHEAPETQTSLQASVLAHPSNLIYDADVNASGRAAADTAPAPEQRR